MWFQIKNSTPSSKELVIQPIVSKLDRTWVRESAYHEPCPWRWCSVFASPTNVDGVKEEVLLVLTWITITIIG